MRWIDRAVFLNNRVARSAFYLSIIWLVILFLFHRYSGKISGVNLEEYLGQFGEKITDFAFFLSYSNTTFIQLFSLSNWAIYLTIFLSSLGVVGGLIELVSGLRRRKGEEFSSGHRSNLLILACAVFFTTSIGTWTVLSSSRKKFVLRRLFVLEVHLVRFEGLLFNSLSVSDDSDLFSTFLEYLTGYFARISALIEEISNIYDFSNGEKIESYLYAAEVDLEDVYSLGVTERSHDEGSDYLHPNPLHSMLLNLEYMQEITRTHIRELE